MNPPQTNPTNCTNAIIDSSGRNEEFKIIIE